MRKKGRMGTFTFVAMFFPLAFLVAMTVLTGGEVIAEDGGGPTHLPIGDWNITGEEVLDGTELIVTGNINVGRGVTLIVTDSVIRVNSSHPHQFTMLVADGASLTVVNSTLDLDIFESDPQSGLDLSENTYVNTRGRCLLRSYSLFADGVTFRNIAPSGGTDVPGEDATMVLDGRVNSEFRNVTIVNVGGDAGDTGPGADGAPGGSSYLFSNVSAWYDCTIECRAGQSRGGGLGLTGGHGGDGGQGADAEVRLRASLLEGIEVNVVASDGGSGTRGSNNPSGNGGDGGSGGLGGSAILELVSDDIKMDGCTFWVKGGTGGSGGTGGNAIDGEGGVAGAGGDGGEASISLQCDGDILMHTVKMTSISGKGGYGGNYGRHEGGTGTFGHPRPGGDGGDASVQVLGNATLVATDLNITARGLAGLDGGGGYDQGERGGDGGDAEVVVHVDETINATGLGLFAYGGNGGWGGPAFSDIMGNGGDGGDARIQFDGDVRTYARCFEIRSEAGDGGRGNKPINDGLLGIGSMDIDTLLLEAWEGTFDKPLDDLHGEAKGYLYNVRFDISSGIHVLWISAAEIWQYFSVDLELGDHVYRDQANPLVDWKVDIISTRSGALLKSQRTDAEGKVRFWILAFHYNSPEVSYLGSIYVTSTSPSKLVSHTVRVEVQAPVDIYIYISEDDPILAIHIETPVYGRTYTFDRRQVDMRINVLDCRGTIVRTDHGDLESVKVTLYEGSLAGRKVARWDLIYKTSPDPWETQPMIYRPDPEINEWVFYVGVDVFNESLGLSNGSYVFEVMANDGIVNYVESVSFDLKLKGFNIPPQVLVTTHINGTVWGGEELLVIGEAWDDVGIVKVEYNLDGTGWKTAVGKEDWEFVINTSLLKNGTHNLSVRALDLYTNSLVQVRTFTVDLPEPEKNGDGNGGPGNDGWEMYTYLFILVIVVVAILAMLSAVVIVRRRSPPDISGDG